MNLHPPLRARLRPALILLGGTALCLLALYSFVAANSAARAQTMPPTPTQNPDGTLPPTATPTPTPTPTATRTPGSTLPPTATPLPPLAPLAVTVSTDLLRPGDTLLLTLDSASLPANATQLVAILPPDTNFNEARSTPGWSCQEAEDGAIFCRFDLTVVTPNMLAFALDLDPALVDADLDEIAVELFAQDALGNILVGTRVVVAVDAGLDLYLPIVSRVQ